MKRIIFTVTLMSVGLGAFAQDFVDNALLFSRTNRGGSARIQALGGAQTALGGDFSSALSNPAGLGMYNRSEFTITPGLDLQNNTSTYRNTPTDDSKTVFHLPGLSLTYHQPSGNDHGFLGGSFALTMSRVNSLNRNFWYQAQNDENSMIDYFIADAAGRDPESMLWIGDEPGDNFFTLTGLAYNNYLIEDVPAGSDTYNSVLSPLPAEPGFPAEIRTIEQREINEAKGAQTQWSISYGANFNDKLFLGAGIGITSLRFKLRQMFRESNFRFSEDPEYRPIDHFETDENYNITGSGVNFTLGGIFRPVNFLQVGASWVTPTYYTITDSYEARIDSEWNIYGIPDSNSFPGQPNVYEEFGEPLISEYNLTTPMRLNAGVTLISKYGFVTADVELVNYSKAKYNSQIDDDFDGDNSVIKGEYQSVVNYRAGAEVRLDNYRLRAGYSFMPDPYVTNDNVDQRIQAFSTGAGLRVKDFFVDIAAIFSDTNRRRSPYFVDGPDPIVIQRFRTTTLLATVGFTF